MGQGFVVEVARAAAPMRVERLAHFGSHVFGHTLSIHRFRATLFKRHAVQFDIARLTAMGQTGVVHDDRVRLMLADHLVERVLLPVLVRFGPVAVEPKPADLAVFGAENLHGIAQILEIRLEIAVEIGVVPVERGVIEERHDPLIPTAFHEIAH